MFRLLEVGESLNSGDEIFACSQWVTAEFKAGENVGDGRFNIPIRRKIESGSGQNSAELAELILLKYKRNVDPSIRCCDFLKEAVVEVLDANSLPAGTQQTNGSISSVNKAIRSVAKKMKQNHL